jgi:hypothetical protein
MTTDSHAPQSSGSSGGAGRIAAVVALLALLGGGAWWWLSSSSEPATAPSAPPKPKEAPRPTALAENDLVLEVDAGAPEQPETPKPKKAEVRSGDNWDCSGELDPASLKAMVAQHHAEVRSCYERRLKVNHQLQGNVALILRIGFDGKVTGTRAGGNLHDEAVYSCIRQIASKWTFDPPTPSGCAVVRIPYNFSPSQ